MTPSGVIALDVRCNAESSEALATHLESDCNAAWAVRRLRAKELVACRGVVPDRSQLGELNTCFEVLGKIRAVDVVRRRYFKLREARARWRQGAADDPDGYAKLEKLVADARTREGIRNRTITLLDDANGRRIIDGNKRAIALYEAGGDDLVLVPVYVLFPSGDEPEQLPVEPERAGAS